MTEPAYAQRLDDEILTLQSGLYAYATGVLFVDEAWALLPQPTGSDVPALCHERALAARDADLMTRLTGGAP